MLRQMHRVYWLLLALLALYGGKLPGQTKADTAHLRDAVSRLLQIRGSVNNSQGAKDMATRAIAAESTYFKSKATVTPPPTNQPPIVSFDFVKNDTTKIVTFTPSSRDPEGTALSYQWKFGDSTTSTAAGVIRHQYGQPGTYNAGFTATDAGGIASNVGKTVTLIPIAAPPVPPDTTPPPALGGIELITGPLVSVASVSALGGAFAAYEADFPAFDEPQWAQCGPRWDCINYYDRAGIYYAWSKRSGTAKYLDRANQTALDFRTNYLEANNYGIAHHWAMCDGVAIHYLTTGDPKSQLAIERVGENFAWQVNGDPSFYFTTPTDFRINAYAIKCLLDAWLIKAPSDGRNTVGWPAVPDWATVLRSALNKILGNLRDADGQWRGAKCSDGTRTSHPFTVGLLYDALLRYYTQFEADPRIPTAIKTSADVMWRDDWVAPGTSYVNPNDGQTYVSPGAFKYVGKSCGPEGAATPAADLNQLIGNGYAFIGKVLADPTFQSRASLIFAGGVNSRGVTGDAKHFNQQYSSSFRALTLRAP